MTPALVALLHLCDSLFPLGSFAHSDGLESAATEGRVTTSADLQQWMDTTLDQSLRSLEGPAVVRAYAACERGDREALSIVDDEVFAMRPSATSRDATRAMGTRLLKTWRHLRPSPFLDALNTDRDVFTLPVSFGIVSWSAGITLDDAVAGYCYTRLAAIVSAAMRLMSIGQHEAHARLASTLERVPALSIAIAAAPDATLQSFAPAMDLAMMRQQYGQSRLFRS